MEIEEAKFELDGEDITEMVREGRRLLGGERVGFCPMQTTKRHVQFILTSPRMKAPKGSQNVPTRDRKITFCRNLLVL